MVDPEILICPKCDAGNRVPRALLGWSIVQGMAAVAAIAALLYWGWISGLAEMQLRSLAYYALVMIVLALVLVNRSFSSSLVRAVTRPNRALVAVVSAVVLFIAAAQYVPHVAGLLSFAPLGLRQFVALAAIALIILLLLEILKRGINVGRAG